MKGIEMSIPLDQQGVSSVNDNKALDVLGIKGLSASVKIATQGLVEGAGLSYLACAFPQQRKLALCSAIKSRLGALEMQFAC